jgi:hypothetical protein
MMLACRRLGAKTSEPTAVLAVTVASAVAVAMQDLVAMLLALAIMDSVAVLMHDSAMLLALAMADLVEATLAALEVAAEMLTSVALKPVVIRYPRKKSAVTISMIMVRNSSQRPK